MAVGGTWGSLSAALTSTLCRWVALQSSPVPAHCAQSAACGLPARYTRQPPQQGQHRALQRPQPLVMTVRPSPLLLAANLHSKSCQPSCAINTIAIEASAPSLEDPAFPWGSTPLGSRAMSSWQPCSPTVAIMKSHQCINQSISFAEASCRQHTGWVHQSPGGTATSPAAAPSAPLAVHSPYVKANARAPVFGPGGCEHQPPAPCNRP